MEFVKVTEDKEIAAVVSLADQTWKEHYTSIIGLKQVEYMLSNFQSEKAILTQIQKGASYYLIKTSFKWFGYFSFVFEENKLFLSKLYVLKAFQGKGFGKLSLQFIKDVAIKRGMNKISLQVNKNNKKSLAFYEMQGFEIIKPIVVDIGNGFVMDDYWMECRLIFN